MDIGFFVAGLVLLPLGAEIMVRGAVAISERMGVSPLVVGLTVVAFGTSLPELVVSLRAALSGSEGIAIGNVVGSNIANILLILGVAAVLSPITVKKGHYVSDGTIMCGVTLLFIPLALSGTVVWWQGLAMIALLVAYLVWSYWREKQGEGPGFADEVTEMEGMAGKSWGMILVATVGGLIGVMVGAELLVTGAVSIARGFGVPEEVIGLTMVAFGTSLPELATAVAAAMKRHAELAVGNIIGSNIFNILAILGITSVVTPLPISPGILAFDMWVMVISALILMPLFLFGIRMGRVVGVAFVAGYVAFIFTVYNASGVIAAS
ncbi:MAG: calcium/sodium antiporter [Rhodospirillum sp.]|nr:calcium/sodium antiporter [Rhodospirillum sp.]MCF8490698.1 calcium/sodium antiporter [Rhodospirillum sp.]MCF8499403.1 calcium/sodium antiporter [Rhodospirillum sp.]